MARLPHFARRYAWLTIISLAPLALFAGCRSNSYSQNNSGGGCCGGGGGGGCCRGTTPNNSPAVAARSGSTAVDSASTPASQGDSVAANTSPSSSHATQRPYGGQKTCPVTGEPLGSMGTPIAVTVKGQTVYVCCRGCVAKVQNDPDGYLRKVQAERGEQAHGTL